MELSIVVINWNAGQLLRRCLVSVQQSIVGERAPSYELIVVDNASTDGSLDAALGALDPSIDRQVVRNRVNRGFGAACNQAVAACRGRMVLLLNPDCELRRGSVERALAEFERTDVRVGVCGIGLENAAGDVWRCCERRPTFLSLMGDACGLKSLPFWPRGRMLEWDHRSDRTVDHVIGAFYLLPASLYRSLGGFDERFFVYYEDMDLSLRAASSGHAVRYIAEPRSMHIGGGTSSRVVATRTFYAVRSRMLFGFKHLPAWQAIAHAAATLLIEPLARSVWCIARRSWSDLRSTWVGFSRLYREMPSIVRTVALRPR